MATISPYIPTVLALVCLGLPCLILAWFIYDCWCVGRELDKHDDL